MMTVMVPDAVAFLPLLAVAVSINHQQDEDDHAANQENDQVWLALPQITDEILEGRVHRDLTYTLNRNVNKLPGSQSTCIPRSNLRLPGIGDSRFRRFLD